MQQPVSVSTWIAGLKAGDADAAQNLWQRFSVRLTDLAKRKMDGAPKSVADEEDIAQSVFSSVCRGAAAGRFADVLNRDDLWWLLLAITKQKVVDHIRRESAQKRGAGRVVQEGALSADAVVKLEAIIGDEPTPDFLAMLQEQNVRLLSLLRDDRLRSVAMSRIEGYTIPEIATRLAISTRSVERKLQLIRNTWAKELSLAN
jgi:DNA-directed RNA polymerase specialized sigma24 family protein